ncbi:FKBP-type peptidyl-prolyl cis-trans isomerase [Apibacter muscae]|uniref:FKBP-type peptidyl-prolyl cis-trans isomerase n=1 Tax=Apibacter muscae TaxID=2509004 RepID=UPI0011AD8819|nr:FKBP-type peptidyl-prolyl cis-trans isomerase [Apibacter muscae]TWP24495.1 FKBP-type peptidyl-prolyl cis-trans isomerase [Apibacter muscae]
MKKNIIAVALCVYALPTFAQKTTKITTDKEKLSYSIGVNIAENLKAQDLSEDVDVTVLGQGMNDVFAEKPLLFTQDSINVFMQKFGQKKMAELQQKREVLGKKNKEEGLAFLATNKKKKGVITTASGLQYEVLSKGTGKETPNATDKVKVKYTGKLLDGKVFDSTDKSNNGQPVEFILDKVIPGWTEGVKLMNKGSKYRFYIPSELGYGENGAGSEIGPNSVLIFDVDLVDFQAQPQDSQEVQGIQNNK